MLVWEQLLTLGRLGMVAPELALSVDPSDQLYHGTLCHIVAF